MIHDIQEMNYKLQFLKFKNENNNSASFISPNDEDMDEIDENNIVCRLPEPSIGRRGELVFPVSFTQYNITK